jgi:sugar lactone lactonase YvrE
MRADVECVWPAKAILGEGPCWDARSDTLFWVDIKDKRLNAFAARDGARRSWAHAIFSLDVPPPTWTPPDENALWFVGCTAAGFCWIGVREDTLFEHTIVHPEMDKPGNRFNDGKVGPDGRYWAGTMDKTETVPSGALYAFSAAGDFERVDTGYIVSNGPAFSPDCRTLYHTDSARRIVYAFDLSPAGRASRRRVFIQFRDDEGYPDGMTADRDGNLWIAMWDGACVQRLSPRGERCDRITVPTQRPTSCVFAGPDQRTMFVTSASIGLPGEDALSGGLFRVDLA